VNVLFRRFLREAAKQDSNLRSRSSGTLLSQDETIDQRRKMHGWIFLLEGRRRTVAFAENNNDSALALFFKSKTDLVR
jgi:hypothetical protein